LLLSGPWLKEGQRKFIAMLREPEGDSTFSKGSLATFGLPVRRCAAENGRQIPHHVAPCMAEAVRRLLMCRMDIFMWTVAISWPVSFFNNDAGKI